VTCCQMNIDFYIQLNFLEILNGWHLFEESEKDEMHCFVIM